MVTSTYKEIDLGARIWGGSGLPKIPRSKVLPLARKVWQRATGKAWPWTWTLGRGNHRTYPRGTRFLVNPDRGLDCMIHDMSHQAFRRIVQVRDKRLVSQKVLDEYCHVVGRRRQSNGWHDVDHCDAHARLEAEMLAHARELIAALKN